MTKTILLLGSKNKSDFAMYLGHTIAAIGKRVVIADATQTEIYKYSFIREEEGETLYDFHNVEILTQCTSFEKVNTNLKKASDHLDNIDYLIVDIDYVQSFKGDWPTFDFTLYISDDDRLSLKRDIDLLSEFMDIYSTDKIRRLHFVSALELSEKYIEMLLHNKIAFMDILENPIEYDEQLIELKLIMQHESSIPFKKLKKDYRNLLVSLAAEYVESDIKEFEKPLKSSLFSIFKSNKKKVDKKVDKGEVSAGWGK